MTSAERRVCSYCGFVSGTEPYRICPEPLFGGEHEWVDPHDEADLAAAEMMTSNGGPQVVLPTEDVRPAYLVLADGLAHLYRRDGLVGRRWDADASYLLTLLDEAGYSWPSTHFDGTMRPEES